MWYLFYPIEKKTLSVAELLHVSVMDFAEF